MEQPTIKHCDIENDALYITLKDQVLPLIKSLIVKGVVKASSLGDFKEGEYSGSGVDLEVFRLGKLLEETENFLKYHEVQLPGH